MEIAFFEDNPTRTKIYPVHPQATENTYRINSTTARKTKRNDYGLESAKPDLQSTFKKPGGDTAAG